MENSEQKLAVIGGGISGLLSAYEAVQQGYDGKNITVFEETNRFGGKIQSGKLGERTVNLGAEFIDSEESNPRIIEICNKLGVNLIPATDQKTEQFQLPDGKFVPAEQFHDSYKPIHEQIIADKNNLIIDNKYTERAIHLENISAADYLKELAANAAKSGASVDQRIIEAAAKIYASESGNDPQKISALQFVNEASSELGAFLGSDCAYRVEGGTEQLIHALKNYLQGAGVNFQTGAKLEEVAKNNGKFGLGFANGTHADERFDNIAIALPAHAVAEVKGLKELGMRDEELDLLKNTQYTHSSKFFVKLKDGVEIDNACLFSGKGFQAWTSENGMLTFLAGGEEINQKKGIELVNYCLDEYAKAHGKKASDLCDMTPENIVFGGPNLKRPCYASPAVGQAMALGGLFGAMERMAQNGVALVGTYFPRRSGNETGVGFMECGASAANRAIGMITNKELARETKIEHHNQIQAANDPNWVQKISANSQSPRHL